MTETPVIEINDLHKAYGNLEVIKGVSIAANRGDVVSVQSESGEVLGCGIIAYDWRDAEKIAGCQSSEIETILGFAGRGAMIHRDNLVMKIDA